MKNWRQQVFILQWLPCPLFYMINWNMSTSMFSMLSTNNQREHYTLSLIPTSSKNRLHHLPSQSTIPPTTFVNNEINVYLPCPKSTRFATFITLIISQITTANVAVTQLFFIFTPSRPVVTSPPPSMTVSCGLTVIYLFRHVK